MARRRGGSTLRLIVLVVAALWVVGKVKALSQVVPFRPATLEEARVAELARRAGFPEPAIASAVAMARCESRFRPDAIGDLGLVDLTWGPSLGLWQIRSRHADFGTGRPRDAVRLTDPVFNAHAAYVLSNGGADWGAWSCR